MFHGQTTASYGIPLADAATAHNEPKGSFGSTWYVALLFSQELPCGLKFQKIAI